MTTMKANILIIALLQFLTTACGNPGKQVAESRTVILNPGDRQISTHDIMEIKGWKELRPDSSTYIGNPSKIECVDGDYFLLVKYPDPNVFHFSSDGSLLHKIGQKGNGEGEFTHAYDFAVDRDSHNVLILSDNSMVYVYSPDGTYVEKIKLPESLICNILSTDAGLYGSSGYADLADNNSNYLLYRYDKDYKIDAKWIPYEKVTLPPYSMAMRNPFISDGEDTYLIDNVNLKLYDLKNLDNSAAPFISFKLDNAMPADIFGDPMKFMEMQVKYNWIMNAVATGSSIIAAYIYDGNYAITQTSKDGTVVRSGFFENGILPIECCSVNGNTIYSVIPGEQYLNFWEKQAGISKPDFSVSDDTVLLLEWSPKTK